MPWGKIPLLAHVHGGEREIYLERGKRRKGSAANGVSKLSDNLAPKRGSDPESGESRTGGRGVNKWYEKNFEGADPGGRRARKENPP